MAHKITNIHDAPLLSNSHTNVFSLCWKRAQVQCLVVGAAAGCSTHAGLQHWNRTGRLEWVTLLWTGGTVCPANYNKLDKDYSPHARALTLHAFADTLQASACWVATANNDRSTLAPLTRCRRKLVLTPLHRIRPKGNRVCACSKLSLSSFFCSPHKFYYALSWGLRFTFTIQRHEQRFIYGMIVYTS